MLFTRFMKSIAHLAITQLLLQHQMIAGQGTCKLGSWTEVGCFQDGIRENRILSTNYTTNFLEDRRDMTVEKCQQFCDANDYIIAGLEVSADCFCGNCYSTTLVASIGGCIMPCVGNTSQKCGGTFSLQMYVCGTAKPPVGACNTTSRDAIMALNETTTPVTATTTTTTTTKVTTSATTTATPSAKLSTATATTTTNATTEPVTRPILPSTTKSAAACKKDPSASAILFAHCVVAFLSLVAV